jgi:hypothetical protein
MDLFTDALADQVAEHTPALPHATAYCLACGDRSHDAHIPCERACALCGNVDDLRRQGESWYCSKDCGLAIRPPIDREPMPSRRNRWGFKGDRRLPAFSIDVMTSMSGYGYVGRYPDVECVWAHLRLNPRHSIDLDSPNTTVKIVECGDSYRQAFSRDRQLPNAT